MAACGSLFVICRSHGRFLHRIRSSGLTLLNINAQQSVQTRYSSVLRDILQLPENQSPAKSQQRLPFDDATDDGIIIDTDEEGTSHMNIRTLKTDPVEHTAEDLLKFYNVDPSYRDALQISQIVRPEYVNRSRALLEMAVMVREPALECLELLKKGAKKDLVATKVMLYGDFGCGKSVTFTHVLNACHTMNWFQICPVNQMSWIKRVDDMAASTYKPGRVDMPVYSVELLTAIKEANKAVFSKHGDEMRTRGTYVWSKREETPPNTTIEQLIDFGIERPKFSDDVVGALLKEIRLHSTEWPTPTVLAIDAVNILFGRTTIYTDRFKQEAYPSTKITLIHNILKLISSEWKNGFMLFTADAIKNPADQKASSHPRYVLGEAGFEVMDPFIPIEVTKYSDEEIHAALNYYVDRKWIQNKAYRTSRRAREELIFLSGKNPMYLDKVMRNV